MGEMFMEWAIGVASFLAGLVSGFSLKLAIDVRNRRNVSAPTAAANDGSVAQSGNFAGGHIAAGNVTTGRE
ncbi:hypothetical protein [Phreatobacter cathodiphilus]|uniref:hypothetical protein n=1 Tax=Phreatobacter cathodiphilus TaxID=1868589 RepID=UPI0011B22025|nr:hypothetical protein [Phreatobacter cathodiphilus]